MKEIKKINMDFYDCEAETYARNSSQVDKFEKGSILNSILRKNPNGSSM